ncbi:MAG: hypothetical protein GY820_24415 [Gammaproteobacteria bacterium]|nr:hypothetical protein [Gammaproteobacteria bacterium]
MFIKGMFNRLQISTKMFLATLIPVSLFILLSIIGFFAMRALEKNNQLVDHTYIVLGHTATIKKLIVDLETGERGFLITGKKSFLEPYNLDFGLIIQPPCPSRQFKKIY